MSKQIARSVSSRMNMQPVLIAPHSGDSLVDALRHLATTNHDDEARDAESCRNTALSAFGYPSHTEDKPFAYADGIAFIPISGLLINRFGYSWSWITGYNFIRSQMNAALEDADVRLIVYDVNSNGGEVAGCFELAEDIFNARSVKPSVAVVDASCYSAAYAIASAANKIILTPSGGAGSIGVVATHISYKKLLDEAGIAVTFIYSGDHKVDGNPYEDLPDAVRAGIQARVDTTRQEFVALVARNRGLDAKDVHDTQAECFSAEEALRLGLVDAIAPPSSAVSAFLNELSGSEFDKESDMTTEAAKPGAESDVAATTDNKVVPSPTAPVENEAAVSAISERAAERERIKAITTHEAAKDKSTLANHLALNTNLSVEAAAGILASSPVEKPTTPVSGNAFAAAMDASEHPNVGAGGEAQGDEGMTAAQRILRSQALATGVKP